MLPGSDPLLDGPLDEILFPQSTTPPARALCKFRPKPFGKPAKPTAATSNAAAKLPKPISTSSSISSHAQRPDLNHSKKNANQQDKGEDILFGLKSDDGQVQTSSSTVRLAGGFQPKANARLEDKKLEESGDAINSGSSLVNAGLFEVDLVDESTQLVGDSMEASKDGDNVMEESDVHSEKPLGEDHALESNANLHKVSAIFGVESVDGPLGKSGKASDMHFSRECFDDNMQHASTSSISDTLKVAYQDGPQNSDGGQSLQINSHKPEEEEILMDSGIGSREDSFLQPCSAAVYLILGVQKVRKFQPKSISRPKERKAKSVSFILPGAGEIAAPNETRSEVLEDHLTGATPFSVQMMTDEFSDTIPHPTSENADFRMDDSMLGNQDLADLSGLESFDSTLSEPTLVTEQTVGKFPPKLGAKTQTRNSSSYTPETCQMNTESLEEVVNLKTADPILERDINLGAKRKTSEISEDIDNDLYSLNADEQTEQSESMIFDDQEASRSSRKLRKRFEVCSPGILDGGNNKDEDIEHDNSQLAEDHDDANDDEHRGDDTPKNVASKKSKKQKTVAQKPAQKRKITKEPDLTKKEPPKKRFPHGTRRKRRQVDKALLETPDSEINPMQLKIRDLIMLREAKERILSKDTAAPGDNQSYHDMSPYGEDHELDEDEEHRNMLKSSRKLNYHSYMNKPQKRRWSKSETASFYEAIRQFGTDFEMIAQILCTSREHVKQKFKREDKENRCALNDAITHRSKDHSLFEKVIQQLKAKEEEESTLNDANGDPTIESEDAINQNEEERCEAEKEDGVAYGSDDDANSFEKFSGWDGDVQYKGYEEFEYEEFE